MTYRLLGLMSIVLLLSLTAFAFLVNHYQDEVMEEVVRTVSDVGRAALQTFETEVAIDTEKGGHAAAFFWSTGNEGDPAGETVVELHGARSFSVPPCGEVVAITAEGKGPFPMLQPAEKDTPKGKSVMMVQRGIRTESQTGGEGISRSRVFVQLQDLKAEEEPGKGFLLRIPALRAEEIGSEEEVRLVAGEPAMVKREDLLLRVPTGDYQSLFATLRTRSALVFLSVFLLGTALSAGLATRFTRPVRRLDTAIHRLTEGDLDAKVEVRGKDEVARLGRAFNDMAHKLRMNRERARELTRREKLSALGRLAAGVAHDVRNPLHSINLTLQHLQETCRPEVAEREQDFDRSLAVIRQEIGRLDKLVENFLRFARSDRRERVDVDLPALARETLRLVEKEAERRGVQVEVRADEAVPPISADMESVRASILNLVLNSFEAMPGGGALRIEVARKDPEVELKVTDTGRGIPKQDQDRVFEFSYTTREGGHGLGLAMVHQVVAEEHGGRVSLHSRPGEGTQVTLVFPVSSTGNEGSS